MPLMAQRLVLIDDIDESEGSTTLTYTFEGQEYEIDLSEANAEKFRKTLQPYIDKSRPVERQAFIPTPTRSSGTRRRSSTGGGSRNDLGEIRAWAQANGHQVAERGRIKKEIIASRFSLRGPASRVA